jgi:hypothetical protein
MVTGSRSTAGRCKVFFTRTLFSICLLSTSLMMLAVALLVRSIPAFAELFVHVIRFLLKWSYHLYQRIFLLLDPIMQNQLGISAMEMPFRMILSVLISACLGCLIMLILRLRISWIPIVVFVSHGIAVTWLWIDFFEPQGLHIGEKI